MRSQPWRGSARRFGSSTKPNRKAGGFIYSMTQPHWRLSLKVRLWPGLKLIAMREVQIKQFDAWEELTKVTRGPI